jgi:Histidine kinase
MVTAVFSFITVQRNKDRTMLERRWLWQAIFWGGYIAFALVLTGQFAPLTSGMVMIMVLVGSGLFAASEVLRKMVLRRGWLDRPGWPLAWRVIGIVPLFTIIVQALIFVVVQTTLALDWITMPAGGADYRPRSTFMYVFNSSIMLWLWSAGWLTWQYVRRFRLGEVAKWRAEAAQHKLELDVLKAQINPHFIFNALNNLRAMINEDTDKARDMVTQLSNILRHTLYHSRRDRVTVADELAVVQDYIALEQLHYEDCLQVEWQVAEAMREAAMPPMLLQLLVENAVKHGIAKTIGGGLITIVVAPESVAHGTTAAKRMHISVSNPGRWEPASDAGIGLNNLRERLLRVSGEGAACKIHAQDGTVRVSVEIPQ